MKCAAAKTRLSFVTVTLNALRSSMSLPSRFRPSPATLEQDDVNRRAREVGGGARVQRVGLVAQRAIERGDRLPARRRADAAGVERSAGAPLARGSRLVADIAHDVRGGGYGT